MIEKQTTAIPKITNRFMSNILCVSNLISKNVRATTCTETNEYKLAMKRKKQLENTMTPEQIEQIEQSKEMARNWKVKK